MEMQEKWINAAARLSQRLHRGQTDKAGADYYLGHLSFVASLGKTFQEKVVGYLHDAGEDTPYSIEEILDLLEKEAEMSFDTKDKTDMAQALHLLNHNTTPYRATYIRNIGEHPLATAVKLNDLTHNMDIRRLPTPSENDYERLKRYKEEYIISFGGQSQIILRNNRSLSGSSVITVKKPPLLLGSGDGFLSSYWV